MPHLRRDCAHPAHICPGTALTPATGQLLQLGAECPRPPRRVPLPCRVMQCHAVPRVRQAALRRARHAWAWQSEAAMRGGCRSAGRLAPASMPCVLVEARRLGLHAIGATMQHCNESAAMPRHTYISALASPHRRTLPRSFTAAARHCEGTRPASDGAMHAGAREARAAATCTRQRIGWLERRQPKPRCAPVGAVTCVRCALRDAALRLTLHARGPAQNRPPQRAHGSAVWRAR